MPIELTDLFPGQTLPQQPGTGQLPGQAPIILYLNVYNGRHTSSQPVDSEQRWELELPKRKNKKQKTLLFTSSLSSKFFTVFSQCILQSKAQVPQPRIQSFYSGLYLQSLHIFHQHKFTSSTKFVHLGMHVRFHCSTTLRMAFFYF